MRLVQDDLEKIQNQLYRMKFDLTLIEKHLNVKEPSWAKEAVKAAKKAGIIERPPGFGNGSMDYYRLLVLLHKKGII